MKSNKIKIYYSLDLMDAGFFQEFCIDLDNNKIIPIRIPNHFNRRKDPFEGEEIYYIVLDDIFDYNYDLHDKFCDNAIRKEYDISDIDSQKLMNFFNNEKIYDPISLHGFNFLNISFYFDDKHHYIHPNYLSDLNNILMEITGKDVLNLKNIITPSKYDLKNNGIYHKDSSQKLKLKTLCFYNRGASWLKSSPEFAIDFDKKRIRGCINKKLSQDDINLIFELMEKYNLYKWTLKEQWRKTAVTTISKRFDGIVWELELIFENDKISDIGGGNAYPDTYVHFGEEIIEKYGADILRLKHILYDSKEYDLLKKYGEKQLNQQSF